MKGICKECEWTPAPSITDAQKKELDYRLTDYLANPNDVLSWDEVKASACAKIL